MIFETHAHYDDDAFDEDRDTLLGEIFSSGICCITDVGASVKSSKSAVALSKKWPQIYAAVEIFNAGTDYWMTVYTQLSKEDVLSWGELDFIQSIAKYISKGKLPTSAQCKRLVKIITKAEDFGYIMPEQ